MPAEDQGPSGSQLYRIAWGIYLLLAVAGALWLGILRDGIRLDQFVDPATWWRDALWGLGAGAGLLGLWEAGRHVLPGARDLERAIADILAGLSPSDALGLALLSGFAEELFFRGAVQGQWGVWVATILFALLHTGPGRPFYLWTAFAAVAGLAFGFLVLHLGNLLAPVLAHVLVNSVNLYRLVTRPPEPAAGDRLPEDDPRDD
jgi:membrane protease YdiL (CAAX protease family)